MSDLSRLLLPTFALGLVAAGCTAENPAFGLVLPGTTGVGTGTGDPSSSGPTSGPTTVSTSAPTSDGTTTESGTTDSPLTTAPDTTEPAGVCGDGVHDPMEECDDGNPSDNDDCLSSCEVASCGDGFVHVGVEACDDGNNLEGDGCTDTCALETCGDGILDDGEECDDGNLDDGDGCSPLCLIEDAACGNGIVDPGEECDDGNLEDTDECLGGCKKAACGDGFVQAGVEECDDGNAIDDDACRNDCIESCGDGKWDANTEGCDGSSLPFNLYPALCSDACKLKTCAAIANNLDINIAGNTWFDGCIMKAGTTITIVVLTGDKILYKATGDLSNWGDPDHITSDAAAHLQWMVPGHTQFIELDNTDRLLVFGRFSQPAQITCLESLGDGYGVAVLPKVINDPKLLVMSTHGGKTGMPRKFVKWSAAHEISYANGATMPLCSMDGPTPALGATAYFLVQ